VLLRGKDPAQLTRYWAAFEKQEKAIKDEAQKLMTALPPGDGRERVIVANADVCPISTTVSPPARPKPPRFRTTQASTSSCPATTARPRSRPLSSAVCCRSRRSTRSSPAC